MKEEAVLFGASSLVGVVTEPAAATGGRAPSAFIFLNAGVTHRVGPNRLYVRLARALAAQGFVALRFDFSGLGDSAARSDDLAVRKSVVLETREAMDFLARTRGVEQCVLIGICSGATVSLMVAREDHRVAGAVLINGQGHLRGADPALDPHLRARTLGRHSWRIALFSSFRSKNWRKAILGDLQPIPILRMLIGAPLGMILGRGTRRGAPEAHEAAADLRALARRGVRLFHLYCEGDEGLDYFNVVLGGEVPHVASNDRARFEIIRGSNHVFTLSWSQDHLVKVVCDWAQTLSEPVGEPEDQRAAGDRAGRPS